MELTQHKKLLSIAALSLLTSMTITGCANQQVVEDEDAVQNETSTMPTSPTASTLPCCEPNPPVVTTPTTPPATQPTTSVTPSLPITAPDGRPSVQVLAATDLKNVRVMYNNVKAAGYQPIIVQMNDLYKVRIPYNSYEEAKANIDRIATLAPDAFVATY